MVREDEAHIIYISDRLSVDLKRVNSIWKLLEESEITVDVHRYYLVTPLKYQLNLDRC